MRGARLNDGLSVLTVGSGPALVVVPGLGAGADLAERVPRSAEWSARALATGLNRTVHLVHRPMWMPDGTSIAELAGWYAAALRERFDRPVDVLGTSAGGVTGLQLAMDHPDLVRRLVMLVAASRADERAARALLESVRREQRGRSAAWAGSGLVARGPLRLLVFGAYALGGRRAPGEAAMATALQGWDVTDRLAEVTAPTLVIGGTRDRIIPPDLVRATAAGIPDSRLLLLPGRDHLRAMYARQVKPAIETFLG
ncbi:3-oxoadipate enol-lactonase [Amycolatopsis ultiminotia]|uniref:3-oxoadipate enol-lactonase n=1 Tax=Amycolatopsis ultiminotia TaxID=543629 RepID=A0ABP6VSW9_9PSEU